MYESNKKYSITEEYSYDDFSFDFERMNRFELNNISEYCYP